VVWNPYRSERVTLHTSLTPEECIQCIQASIRSFWYDSASDAPFFGSVNGCTFTVYKARLFGRRGVRANAEGEIAADAGADATITIRLPVHVPGWPLFLPAYGLSIIFIVSASQVFTPASVGPVLATPLTILVSLILGAAGVYCYGLIASLFLDDQREFLISTLRECLAASVVTSKAGLRPPSSRN
jgi:hypothetical protein